MGCRIGPWEAVGKPWRAVEPNPETKPRRARQVREDRRRIGEDRRRVGESRRRVGECSRRIGEGRRWVGEGRRRVGEGRRRVGEARRRVGEGRRRRRGSVCDQRFRDPGGKADFPMEQGIIGDRTGLDRNGGFEKVGRGGCFRCGTGGGIVSPMDAAIARLIGTAGVPPAPDARRRGWAGMPSGGSLGPRSSSAVDPEQAGRLRSQWRAAGDEPKVSRGSR